MTLFMVGRSFYGSGCTGYYDPAQGDIPRGDVLETDMTRDELLENSCDENIDGMDVQRTTPVVWHDPRTLRKRRVMVCVEHLLEDCAELPDDSEDRTGERDESLREAWEAEAS